jgi:hypothetical protein
MSFWIEETKYCQLCEERIAPFEVKLKIAVDALKFIKRNLPPKSRKTLEDILYKGVGPIPDRLENAVCAAQALDEIETASTAAGEKK